MPQPPAVVAVPVRNEAERIGRCLDALHRQDGASLSRIVLVLDRCTDATAAIVARHPAPLDALVRDGADGHAGMARRMAMDHACEVAGPGGVVLTTDADGEVPPDWLVRNLTALRHGADLVAGRAVIDPDEALLIPSHLHAADAAECAYAAVLDEIASLADPDPADPWPRHTEASGASLAMWVASYRACGGLPRAAVGEDRALVAAFRRGDMRVRHDPGIAVTVSGRTEGRAAGGMADTIRRRMVQPDAYLDDALEPALAAARRARLRWRARRMYRAGVSLGSLLADASGLAAELGLSPEHLGMLLLDRSFGMAWEAVEAASPALRRRRVAVTGLSAQMRAAVRILEGLRGDRAVSALVRRAGRPACPAVQDIQVLAPLAAAPS